MKESRSLPDGGQGPLYKQLADLISKEISMGEIKRGSSLPTVRDLASEMELSAGTVMHAYDELERLGVIEKVRGKGTFVRHKDDTPHGKRQRAALAMEEMFSKMRSLGFSLSDIKSSFEAKLNEIEQTPKNVSVVVVDCNPEALYVIANQISQLRGAQVSCRLLENLSYVPGLMEDDSDIIVTTSNHYEMVVQAAAREERVCRVVLSPSAHTVAGLAKTEGKRVGMLTASGRFAWIIGNVCAELSRNAADIPKLQFGDKRISDFLFTLDTLILPDYYRHFCNLEDELAIEAFRTAGGDIIEFTYHLDAGSMMYLEQIILSVIEQMS